MSRTIQKGSATDKIINYIYENTACSASPQTINKKLELNVSPSTMHKKIRDLRENGYICEVNGRYYHWDKLPKELEKYI